ncbi:MAG: hypothetical protein M2R45_01296 [Verrucomicrobia subdivision 3 bacterium]|nr:hypothetical protein [Limisphaerales bacterium]MCS1415162.1 hypothetical protein [Limisphaerales bacterium]
MPQTNHETRDLIHRQFAHCRFDLVNRAHEKTVMHPFSRASKEVCEHPTTPVNTANVVSVELRHSH